MDPVQMTPHLSQQLEAVFGAARQLEVALSQERLRMQQAQRDLYELKKKYDEDIRDTKVRLQEEIQQLKSWNERTRTDYEQRIREILHNEEKSRAELQKAQEIQAQSIHRVNEFQNAYQAIQREVQQLRAELTQYRMAWSDVLRREEVAKKIQANAEALRTEVEQIKARLQELTASESSERERREKAENTTEAMRTQLREALVRSHAAESRLSEMDRELQALRESRRNIEDELAQIEASVKERYGLVLVKKEEELRAELEKRVIVERERLKQELESSSQANRMELERSKAKLEEELKVALRTKDALTADLRRVKSELIETSEALLQTEPTRKKLEEDLDQAMRDAALARAQLDQAKIHFKNETNQISAQAQSDKKQMAFDYESKEKKLLLQIEALNSEINKKEIENKTQKEDFEAQKNEINHAVSEVLVGKLTLEADQLIELHPIRDLISAEERELDEDRYLLQTFKKGSADRAKIMDRIQSRIDLIRSLRSQFNDIEKRYKASWRKQEIQAELKSFESDGPSVFPIKFAP